MKSWYFVSDKESVAAIELHQANSGWINNKTYTPLELQPADRHIYERGCLRAMEDWLESHLLMVASATCSTMIIQVLEFNLVFCFFSSLFGSLEKL